MIFYCKKSEQLFVREEGKLTSPLCSVEVREICGHEVSIFAAQAFGVNEFSVKNATELHKNAMNWLHDTHETTEHELRSKLIEEIHLVKNAYPKKILVTSCGEGNDLPYLFKRYPNATFYIQDIAEEMLAAAIQRTKEFDGLIKVFFWLGDACDLPFQDNIFDIVYHFGGLNLFSSPEKGVSEMHRVGAIGSSIIFGDEGIAPFIRECEIGKALINNNPLYAALPPLSAIPPYVEDFKLQYVFNNCFYLVTYRKTDNHNINIDIPHKGLRGGTIRTRFYGQLEGINPSLRDAVFDTAKSLGISRVALLEKIIENGIKGLKDGEV
jgi:SAM-dependent methyltransferase